MNARPQSSHPCIRIEAAYRARETSLLPVAYDINPLEPTDPALTAASPIFDVRSVGDTMQHTLENSKPSISLLAPIGTSVQSFRALLARVCSSGRESLLVRQHQTTHRKRSKTASLTALLTSAALGYQTGDCGYCKKDDQSQRTPDSRASLSLLCNASHYLQSRT